MTIHTIKLAPSRLGYTLEGSVDIDENTIEAAYGTPENFSVCLRSGQQGPTYLHRSIANIEQDLAKEKIPAALIECRIDGQDFPVYVTSGHIKEIRPIVHHFKACHSALVFKSGREIMALNPPDTVLARLGLPKAEPT